MICLWRINRNVHTFHRQITCDIKKITKNISYERMKRTYVEQRSK